MDTHHKHRKAWSMYKHVQRRVLATFNLRHPYRPASAMRLCIHSDSYCTLLTLNPPSHASNPTRSLNLGPILVHGMQY